MARSKPNIAKLRASVEAAREEFDLAVVFHAMWKPTAYDTDLHRRMGVSYATHGLRIIRTACRRELILALCRLWDRDDRAVGMEAISKALSDRAVIDELAVDRAAGAIQHSESPISSVPNEALRETIQGRASEAIGIINRYVKGGSEHRVLTDLRYLRNKRLAHREVTVGPDSVARASPHDHEVEAFYDDMAVLIRTLLSTVLGHAYDPTETADVFGTYAKFFWAGVSGERTEGHPLYRASPPR